MVERDDAVGRNIVQVFQALHFRAENRAIEDEQEIVERPRRHGEGDGDGDGEIEQTETQEERRDAHAELLQQRDHDRRRHHERGVEHIDGGDHARAAIRAGPGLHGRECRHDEQAAGDREADHRERDIQRRARSRRWFPDRPVGAAASHRKRRSRDREKRRRATRRRSKSAAARYGRSRARRQGRSRPRPRWKRSRDNRCRPTRRRRAVLSPWSATATGRPRRPARTSSSPARPTTIADRYANAGSAPTSTRRYFSTQRDAARLRRCVE